MKSARPIVPPIRTELDLCSAQSDHRWSEFVPPQTALTFVAVYDPSEGLLAFSGGSLLPLDHTGAIVCSSSSYDRQPDAQTLARLAAGTPALSTAALTSDSAMRDMQIMLGAYLRGERHPYAADCLALDATPRVSSALEGPYFSTLIRATTDRTPFYDDATADVRERDCSTFNDHGSSYSSAGRCTVEARAAIMHSCVDSFFVYTDSKLERFNERSAFSVTTTSTSDYIDVGHPVTQHDQSVAPDLQKSARAFRRKPDLHGFLTYIQPRPQPRFCKQSSSSVAQKANKSYKARSQAVLPASPADVLARTSYNYNSRFRDTPARPKESQAQRPKLVRALSNGFMRLKRNVSGGEWVRIEVEHRTSDTARSP